MDDMLIRTDLALPGVSQEKPGEKRGAEKSFRSALSDAIDEINKLQLKADEAISRVQLGSTGSIHEAIISIEKAGISFQTMMQVRNKILDAYQEIMRMQV